VGTNNVLYANEKVISDEVDRDKARKQTPQWWSKF